MEDDYEETIFEEIEEGLFNDGDLTINEEYLTSFNAACDDVCTNAKEGRDIIEKMMDKCGGLVDFGSDRDALEASYKKLCRVGNYKAAMNRYVTAVSEFDRNLADRFIAIRSEDNDQENKEWTDINEELAFRADTVMSPTPVANMRKLSGSSILPVSEENNAISSATASYAGMMRADYDRNKNVDTMFTQCSTVDPQQFADWDKYKDGIDQFDIDQLDLNRDFTFDLGSSWSGIIDIQQSQIDEMKKIMEKQEAEKKIDEKLTKILDKPFEKMTSDDWKFISDVYVEAVDNINTVRLEKICNSFEVMSVSEVETELMFEGVERKYVNLSMSFDTNKISKMLENIDYKTQSEAYFSLTRLANTVQTQKIYLPQFAKEYEYTDIDFYKNDDRYRVHVKYDKGKRTISLGNNKITLKELDMDNILKTMVSPELGFSEEQVVTILATATTDKELDFFEELGKCRTEDDYKKVFMTDPDIFSVVGMQGLNMYAYWLMDNHLDIEPDTKNTGLYVVKKTSNFVPLENFINGLLMSEQRQSFILGEKERRVNKYLGILSYASKQNLENNCDAISNIAYMDGEITNEHRVGQYKLYNYYGLMQSLSTFFCDAEHRLSNGGPQYFTEKYRISNLGWDDEVTREMDAYMDKVMFSYAVTNVTFGEEDEEKVVLQNLSKLEVDSYEELNEYQKAVEEMEKAESEALTNIALSFASAITPAVGDSLKAAYCLIQAGSENDGYVDAGIESLNGAESVADALGKGFAITGDDAGILSEVYSSFGTIEETRTKVKELQTHIWDNNFYNGIGMGDLVLAKGIYNPDKIALYAQIERHGLSVMCDNEKDIKIGKEIIDSEEESIENMKNSEVLNEFTTDQMREILKAFWCIDEYRPTVKNGIVINGRELLNDLDNVQKKECLIKLNEVLKASPNEESVQLFSENPSLEYAIEKELGKWK